MFFERSVPPAPDARAAARSLAVGVLELCELCEELLTLAAARHAAPHSLAAISEQLDAVRATAAPLATRAPAHEGAEAYSLSALGQWVWRE